MPKSMQYTLKKKKSFIFKLQRTFVLGPTSKHLALLFSNCMYLVGQDIVQFSQF